MKSLNTNVNNDFLSIIKKEGRFRAVNSYVQTGSQTSRTIDSNGTTSSAAIDSYPTLGKHAWLESITITTDKACLVAITIRQPWEFSGGQVSFLLTNEEAEYSDYAAGTVTVIKSTNNIFTIPLNILIRDGGRFRVAIQKNDTGPRAEASATYNLTEFAADLNFNAPKKILLCGDSTTWYGLGNDNSGAAFDGQNLWGFLLRNKIQQTTKVAHRIINLGFGGSTALQWRNALKSDVMAGIDYDLLVVNLGMNDAQAISGSYTIANVKSYLSEFINYRNWYNPNAKMLYLAPNVTDDAAKTTNIAAVRTAISEVVSEAGGVENGIYYVNKALAFSLNATATADTNFVNDERSAGNRVHPGGNGNALIADYIYTQTSSWITNL